MRFSRRLDWHGETNAIARAIEARRAGGRTLIDLTVSNPTAAGFDPPPGLVDAFARGSSAPYQPEARGSRPARVALAAWLGRHGVEHSDPDELFLTSSTSEAYGWILKLLCDPGDRVTRLAPTYPLLDHLCALEAVQLDTLRLESGGGRWTLPDDQELRDTVSRSKAVIVVHPNNPTGNFLSRPEVRALSAAAMRDGAAIIADEVFFEFGRVERRRVASDSEALTFSLGGLSKSAALPHWKLGWIRITGPEEQKRNALAALELIADTYLPVSGPVQRALPEILDGSEAIRRPVQERIETNLQLIDAAISGVPAVRRDPVEGGWSAVLRVPVLESEERLVLDLIDAGALVHPGFFYDFPREGWLVLSLLVRSDELQAGMEVIREHFC